MLTDQEIKGLEPQEKQYETADGKIDGLALRVLPSGTKSWSFRYRNGSRWRRVSLGKYPTVGLADARELATEHYLTVKRGGDPSKEKREAREAEDDTFGAVCELYLDRHALGPDVGPRQKKNHNGIPAGTLLDPDGNPLDIWKDNPTTGTPRKRSWKADRRMLQTQVPKSWRRRPIQEIDRRQVRKMIEDKAAIHPIQANRLRALLSKVFNFALGRDLVEYNPVQGIEPPTKETSRDRVLSEDEIRTFWKATKDMKPPMRAWWRLRLVTAQRMKEINSMEWADLDLDNAVWTIPAGVCKNKQAHRVPLSPLAMEIIGSLKRVEDHVLAGARGHHQQRAAVKGVEVEDWTGHDLRRTAASFMARAGVPRLHISKVLNHADPGVTAVYDRHSYDAEKRVALDTWARKLAEIMEPAKGADVVPITGRS